MLIPRKRVAQPEYDAVWIARTDGDKANAQTEVAARLSSQAAEKFAMPGFADGIEMSFVAKHRPQAILLTDWQALVFDNQQARWALKRLDFDSWAEILVSRALHVLSLGHVVITDRLHAHLLCLMLRIPHVLLNDGSGKNWSFHERWTKDIAFCRLARDPAEAWSLARNAAMRLKELSPLEVDNWSWQSIADPASASGGRHP
jgi:exopolysaccharide biosynthesis predicted pyruvyltransferase EpsI